MATLDLIVAEAIMRHAVPLICPAAQLVVRWRGLMVCQGAYGWLAPETRQQPTQPGTLFDLASVTKLFVVTAFMTLVEQRRVMLAQPVFTVLEEFDGMRPIQPYEDPLNPGAFVTIHDRPATIDSRSITFQHLLTHSSGLPAWRPLFRQGSPDAARHMALSTFFASPPGLRVIYSDVGLILLGMAIERITGLPLDMAVAERVTTPAGLDHTRYLPIGMSLPFDADVAPTEVCTWRGRRVCGEVHDENAAALGGVAGHAGLFSTAADVAAFGQLFLNGGQPLLRAETVAEMTRTHCEMRGLGFALWSPDPDASGNPFSTRAFGHTGFTGTSLWIDPQRGLVVALLTNEVYYGRQGRNIGALRVALHRAIVAAVDAVSGR